MAKAGAALKRVMLGRPMSSGELEHTLLPKTIALPVFSSDPLSSNAYATQEILLVLGLAGTANLGLVVPIAMAVACLLGIVVTSYRQTVKAYPTGGGAYRVSSENLGMYAGLLAAAALLLDYVLTVSVSITAGVDAIVSAAQGLDPYRVPLAVAFIVFVTLVNLRGVKESGSFFAVPTYGFVAIIYLLIVTGIVQCLGGCPDAESAGTHIEPESALTFLLILKAFAAGTTALTGVEAIADGVQAFRYPQSKNAAATLTIMGLLATSMFLGISWLANKTEVVFVEHHSRTVVAQIGAAVFGEGILFYVLQFMTAGILILAANTAFQDFPRLSSILAHDKFMPRQFMNRGDRLVFSNGVLILATAAALLVVVFEADLTQLIQLYLVGVFISFTLSQSGMVLRWRRLRESGWQAKALLNGFGATVTTIVFFVIVTTKFAGGAWMIMVAIPVVMYGMYSVHKHYTDVQAQLGHPERRPPDRRPGNQHLVIAVDQVTPATARAVGYCESIQASELVAVAFDEGVRDEWQRLAPDIPLHILERNGNRAASLQAYLRTKRKGLAADDFLTVVVPEMLRNRGLFEILRRPQLHRLKGKLLREEGVQVMDIPLLGEDAEVSADDAHVPGRNYVIVLVSAVHNSTLQAIEYAETLQPTDIRAVSFGLDAAETEKLGNAWLQAGIPHPLEIEASPFRDIGESLLHYLRPFKPDGIDRVVTVVMPEFVVGKRRHNILHGQTALLVKRRLLFEPGVVAVSVPYPLEREAKRGSPTDSPS
ncbi:MAG: APC family permease [Actinomycetota bacterium]|nr:APC family permease [Actinomycetota bacterium]